MVLHILWPSMHQPESLSYYSQWLPLISYYYDSICLFFCIVSNFNILKMPALLAHPGLFWCFRTPLNSDMDNAVYKVHMCCMIFLHAHTPGRPWFVISSKGLGVHPTEHYCDYSSTALESSAMVLFAGKLPSEMVLHILWPSMHQPESLSYYSQWLPLISYYYDSICLLFLHSVQLQHFSASWVILVLPYSTELWHGQRSI